MFTKLTNKRYPLFFSHLGCPRGGKGQEKGATLQTTPDLELSAIFDILPSLDLDEETYCFASKLFDPAASYTPLLVHTNKNKTLYLAVFM
jgi:hypothetical protein